MNTFDRAMQHAWMRWLWFTSFAAIGLYILFGGQPSASQNPTQTSSASLAMRRSHDLQISDSFSIGRKTIEALRVGDRVLAENPQVTTEERAAYIEPNWNDWLHISLSLAKPDGSQLDIEMLRTEEWFIEQSSLLVQPKEEPSNDQQNSEGIKPQTTGLTFPTLPEFNLINAGGHETELSISADAQRTDFESTTGVPWRPAYAELFRRHARAESEGQEPVGLLVQMDLPEMGVTGEAIVTNIQPAPAVQSGNGRVVTATFKHSSGDCIDLVVADSDTKETLGTTSNHPFWSVDRQDYVQAGSLQIDERVQTYSGDTKRVISKLARPGPEPVYNLEVHGEHVYYVGQQGVLVHNTQGYKTDAVAGVDPEILVRHRAGNTQVMHNGTRWNLPTRDTGVLPKSDVLGDHIQQLAYKHAQNFKFEPTRKQASKLAELKSEGKNTYGILKRWETQAKGRYVDANVKRDLAISHPHLALNSRGVDIFDSHTGLSYEILYKSAKNIHTHAMRMPNTKFRYIEFR